MVNIEIVGNVFCGMGTSDNIFDFTDPVKSIYYGMLNRQYRIPLVLDIVNELFNTPQEFCKYLVGRHREWAMGEKDQIKIYYNRWRL